jgi:translation initiation factor IF-3
VRLIGSDGSQMGVVAAEDALARASEEGLDLVEVAPTADPPVCRIMDFGKYKYQQKKKQHSSKKVHHQQTKEIRLRLKTEEHDLQVKVKHAREFLEKGDRVLLNLLLRGREMSHADMARRLLDHFAQLVEDLAKVDKPAAMDRSRLSMMLVPKEHGKPS